MLLSGIILVLAFVVTSLTLSQVSNLDGRSLQDRDRAFLNEWQFLHTKIGSTLRDAVSENTDALTFYEIFNDAEATVKSLEAEKGYHAVLHLGNTTEDTPTMRNEFAFVNMTTGFYQNWTYDGTSQITDIPYDGTMDGVVFQDGKIVGVVVNIYLTDGVRASWETVLYALNTVARTEGQGNVPTNPQNLDWNWDGQYVNLSWSPPAYPTDASRVSYSVYLDRGDYLELKNKTHAVTYSHIELDPGTYLFHVRANTSVLAGRAESTTITFTTEPPLPPVNLAYTRADGYINLTWDPPAAFRGSPVLHYKVFRDDGAGPVLVATTTSATQRTYSDTGLVEGQVYTYHVTAVNGGGESDPSAPVSGRFAHVPGPAGTPAVTDTGHRRIALSWAAATDDNGDPVTGYAIYRGISPETPTYLATTGGLTYTDTSVDNNVTYLYAVAAVNGVGAGPWNGLASGMAHVTIPTAPRDLQASSGNRSVTLTWTAPEDLGADTLDRYNLTYGTAGVCDQGPIVLGGDLLTYEHQFLAGSTTRLTNGTTYTYCLTAASVAGPGPASDSAAATPAGAPFAPASVAVAQDDRTLRVTWTPVTQDGGSPLTGYRIWKRTDIGASTLQATVDPDVVTYNDTAVSVGSTYQYEVQALNALGPSANRTSNSLLMAPTTPAAPESFAVSSGGSWARLSWSAPSDTGGSPILNYTLYRSTDGVTFTAVYAHDTTLSFNDTTVTAGVTYTYRVSAWNLIGQSDPSTLAVTPAGSAPGATGSFAVTGVSSGTVSFSWTAAASPTDPVTKYVINYSSAGPSGPWTSVDQTTALTGSVNALTNGQAYHFTVVAVNGVGWGPTSSALTGTPYAAPSAPTSLSAVSGNRSITISWAAPSSTGGGISTYHVEYRVSAEDPWSTVTVDGSTFTKEVTGLTNGTAYMYRVRAENPAGPGPDADGPSTVTPKGAPLVPQSVSATGGVGSISVTWSPPSSDGGSSLTGYFVQRRAGTDGAWTTLVSPGPSTTLITDTTATMGITYYYRVAAVNAEGQSSWSLPSNGAARLA